MIRKVAAAILSTDDGALLVVRKRGRDIFILPGGKPEGAESPEETLTRELWEELRVRPNEMVHLMHVDDEAVFESTRLEMEVFLTTIEGPLAPAGEIEEFAFVPNIYSSSGLRLATGITHHVLPKLFPDTLPPQSEEVAVMFSGGRDSTAVAAYLHEQGHPLHLLRFRSGLGTDDGELFDIRLRELDLAWGTTFTVHKVPVGGLVREFCFKHLVDDVLTDHRQLILLGEGLAMVVASIDFCRAHNVRFLAMGATKYQSNFPEQQPRTLQAFADLCKDYGVTFIAPGHAWASELEVKDRLRFAGFSAKSLEGASLLADLDDNPPRETVEQYLSRKLPIARAHLDAIEGKRHVL